MQFFNENLAELEEISQLVKNNKSTLEGVRSLVEENSKLKKGHGEIDRCTSRSGKERSPFGG